MIVIPEWAWGRLLDIFTRMRDEKERVAFLDGVPFGGADGVVTTVTVPDAVRETLQYAITAAAMSEAGKHLRAHRLVRLAQVHTHPGDWTDHSVWDDRLAYSQEPAAISIVLPFHGRNSPDLAEAGVHLREPTGWRRLPPAEVPLHVRLVPSAVDLRRG